jgi:hypothetical protein
VGAYLRSCGESCCGCFRLIATFLDLHGEWTGMKEAFELCCWKRICMDFWYGNAATLYSVMILCIDTASWRPWDLLVDLAARSFDGWFSLYFQSISLILLFLALLDTGWQHCTKIIWVFC